MVSFGALGIMLMSVNGVLNAAMVVTGKLLQEMDWPYFRLMSISSSMIVLCISLVALYLQVPIPSLAQAKWLTLRGLFGSMAFLLQISAVRTGASLGDAAALASINTMIAALFGRVFLGERLQWSHGVAVACSMSGATLIAKPSFLFGASEEAHPLRWLGYSLAATSGLMQACVFISARKSSKSPLLLLNMSPAIFCALVFSLVPFAPFVDDASWQPALQAPGSAAVVVSMFFLIQFGAMSTNS